MAVERGVEEDDLMAGKASISMFWALDEDGGTDTTRRKCGGASRGPLSAELIVMHKPDRVTRLSRGLASRVLFKFEISCCYRINSERSTD